jgi:hypothetical protein
MNYNIPRRRDGVSLLIMRLVTYCTFQDLFLLQQSVLHGALLAHTHTNVTQCKLVHSSRHSHHSAVELCRMGKYGT